MERSFDAPAPDWLRKSWAEARSNGLNRLSMEQIQDEIDRAREAAATNAGTVRTSIDMNIDVAPSGDLIAGQGKIIPSS